MSVIKLSNLPSLEITDAYSPASTLNSLPSFGLKSGSYTTIRLSIFEDPSALRTGPGQIYPRSQ
jgi:hypothetical protein